MVWHRGQEIAAADAKETALMPTDYDESIMSHLIGGLGRAAFTENELAELGYLCVAFSNLEAFMIQVISAFMNPKDPRLEWVIDGRKRGFKEKEVIC